jgi:hypothetical protein
MKWARWIASWWQQFGPNRLSDFLFQPLYRTRVNTRGWSALLIRPDTASALGTEPPLRFRNSTNEGGSDGYLDRHPGGPARSTAETIWWLGAKVLFQALVQGSIESSRFVNICLRNSRNDDYGTSIVEVATDALVPGRGTDEEMSRESMR